MKSLNEFYNEVISDDKLKKEFLEILKENGDLDSFLKRNDCPVVYDELEAFLKGKQDQTRELTEAEMAAIAGGTKSPAVQSACNLGLDCEWDKIF